ncbi:MAG TPA: hypothetical protein VFA98_10400, partial [Thermoanaerobaculia bacterium]|nr:hypothetical protein [Thermoanaerobaculia bacterium]
IGRDVTLSTQSGTSGSQSVVTGLQVKTANPADPGPSGASPDAPRQPVTYTSTQTSSPMAAPGPSASGGSGQYTSGQSSTQSGSAGSSAGSGQSSDVPPTSGLSGGTSNRSDTSAGATRVSGRVTAYQPKESITIERPGKGTVTYTIDAHSDLPQDVAVGRTVTITTTTAQGASKPVVRTVTTTTRTTKMTTESHPQ